MSYDLIALDLDGSLTDSNKEVPEDTRTAIMQKMQQGKKVVLVSGRTIPGVMPVAEYLELGKYGGYAMGFNGGKVVDCRTGRIMADHVIPEGFIRPVWELLKDEPDTCLLGYSEEAILAGMQPNQYVGVESIANRLPLVQCSDFPEEIPQRQNKMLVCTDPSHSEHIVSKLQNSFGRELNIFPSELQYIEIMPKGIDKGQALKELTEMLGLTPDRVIACGDSGNDIPMIRYAGLGVAMGNAMDGVKAAADYVTLTNDEEGVLAVIKKFF